MNKKIIVTAFLLAAGLFATRNAQAQRTYEEMERLTVNEPVSYTHLKQQSAPCCLAGILSLTNKSFAISNLSIC